MSNQPSLPLSPSPGQNATNPVRKARRELGLTQQDLADALEVSLATVRRLEQGDTPVRRLHTLALESLLGRQRRLLRVG